MLKLVKILGDITVVITFVEPGELQKHMKYPVDANEHKQRTVSETAEQTDGSSIVVNLQEGNK